MNYYIQGSPARAEEIKAAFEKLGYNSRRLNFSDGFFYTVERDVHYCVYDYMVNIIKTHPDYKELELPVEPKFKVGDEIKTGNTIETIAEVDYATRSYCCKSGRTIWFENQDLWHLVSKPHYDISNFHAGMPVLVRDNNKEWRYVPFSHITNGSWKFNAVGTIWEQCIPFDGNEHLLGTTDMCDEQYINW